MTSMKILVEGVVVETRNDQFPAKCIECMVLRFWVLQCCITIRQTVNQNILDQMVSQHHCQLESDITV